MAGLLVSTPRQPQQGNDEHSDRFFEKYMGGCFLGSRICTSTVAHDGSYLPWCLKALKTFRATVLPKNKAMLNVFYNSGYSINTKFDGDTYNISYDLDKPDK